MSARWWTAAILASVVSGKAGNTGLPMCKNFQCPAGEKLVPKEGFTPWSYGCLEIPQLDKCCIERDVCMRTCGMTSRTCFMNFEECSAKICGKDYTCRNNAKVLGQSTGGKNDKELCETYKQGQSQACDCASKYVWKRQLNSRLVDFYRKHQPDKLDASGELREADRIWKKWDGNEPTLFMTLTMKYWEKAVDLKAKTGQTRPSSKKRTSRSKGSTPASSQATKRPSPRPSFSTRKKERGATVEKRREEREQTKVELAFANEIREVEDLMREAGRREHYVTARTLQLRAAELREKELMRLEYAKEQAVKAEDFKLAKSIKAEQLKLRSKLQEPHEPSVPQTESSPTRQRTNVDRVGSRARLELKEEPLFEAVEDHDIESARDAVENDRAEAADEEDAEDAGFDETAATEEMERDEGEDVRGSVEAEDLEL